MVLLLQVLATNGVEVYLVLGSTTASHLFVSISCRVYIIRIREHHTCSSSSCCYIIIRIMLFSSKKILVRIIIKYYYY